LTTNINIIEKKPKKTVEGHPHTYWTSIKYSRSKQH